MSWIGLLKVIHVHESGWPWLFVPALEAQSKVCVDPVWLLVRCINRVEANIRCSSCYREFSKRYLAHPLFDINTKWPSALVCLRYPHMSLSTLASMNAPLYLRLRMLLPRNYRRSSSYTVACLAEWRAYRGVATYSQSCSAQKSSLTKLEEVEALLDKPGPELVSPEADAGTATPHQTNFFDFAIVGADWQRYEQLQLRRGLGRCPP
jgi:hypothetical protein